MTLNVAASLMECTKSDDNLWFDFSGQKVWRLVNLGEQWQLKR